MTSLLFLCVANSVRSQMAEGFASAWFGGQASVRSAGSQPTFLHPVAVRVMAELDIDISYQCSKGIGTIDLEGVDIVIIFCAEEACPVLPGSTEQLNWPILDPVHPCVSSDEEINYFREVRDEIAFRLKMFADERSLRTMI